MKLNKYFMLGLAGLAFAACSNEEELNNVGDGDAVVRVNIVTDAVTRAVEPGNPTSGNDGTTTPVVVNTLKLKLTAEKGSAEVSFPEAGNSEPVLDQVKDYTFSGVRNPRQLEVFINGGQKANLELKNVYNVGLAEPLYASKDASQFGTPVEVNDVLTYTVSLEPLHELALVEFSNIKHAGDDPTLGCMFNAINFDGLFLNNIVQTEKGTAVTKYSTWAEASNASAAPTYSIIADADKNFLTVGAQWPATGKCYAYNVFPGTTPNLTLCFSGIATKPGMVFPGGKIGYATVGKYILNTTGLTDKQKEALGVKKIDETTGSISEFKAGYVYRINKINVPDSAIGPTVDGGENVNVVVAEVTVTPWTLVSGTVEWL